MTSTQIKDQSFDEERGLNHISLVVKEALPNADIAMDLVIGVSNVDLTFETQTIEGRDGTTKDVSIPKGVELVDYWVGVEAFNLELGPQKPKPIIPPAPDDTIPVSAESKQLFDDLLEALSDAEHASWGSWMDYLFSKCDIVSVLQEDEVVGTNQRVIPSWAFARWTRQAATPYAQLTEQEKESDRNEVRKILPLIEQYVQARIELAQKGH